MPAAKVAPEGTYACVSFLLLAYISPLVDRRCSESKRTHLSPLASPHRLPLPILQHRAHLRRPLLLRRASSRGCPNVLGAKGYDVFRVKGAEEGAEAEEGRRGRWEVLDEAVAGGALAAAAGEDRSNAQMRDPVLLYVYAARDKEQQRGSRVPDRKSVV